MTASSFALLIKVILDKCDYIEKMETVLSDSAKFQHDDFQIDLTQKVEKRVRSEVSDLLRKQVIDKDTAKFLSPTGSSMPRLYGLPKIHKPDIPLRPILSMVNSPTYNLSKFVNQVLQPVREAVSSKTVSDSFDFVSRIRALDLSSTFLCSFDVSSLFTNVPLHETISFIKRICDDLDIELRIDFDHLKSLILLCTQNTQFSFNNTFYFQCDGVAMGSPLGPTLADIFVGYTLRRLSLNVMTSVLCIISASSMIPSRSSHLLITLSLFSRL